MRVVVMVQIRVMTDLGGDPGKVRVKRDRLFRGVHGSLVVFFGTVQGHEGKRSGMFLFVAGLRDAAKNLFGKDPRTPGGGIVPGNEKDRQGLAKSRHEKERERERKSDAHGPTAWSEGSVLLPNRKVRALDGLKDFAAKFFPFLELGDAALQRLLIVHDR